MGIANKIKDLAVFVDSLIEDSLSASDVLPGTLSQASIYSLKLPGKRLRPALSFLVSEMLEVSKQSLESFAVAIEHVHTATLIHDDLPAMDNDSLRRGMPTCHIAYGEHTAILAGDMLISRAFLLISKDERIKAHEKVFLIELLSDAIVKVCYGQQLDLEAEKSAFSNITVTPEEAKKALETRHRLKTGALLQASVLAPLAFKSVSEQEKSALYEFSDCLGLLYQVTDDVLDVTQDSKTLGKDAGSDARQGTPTYVSVYGLEQAKELSARYAKQAKDSLSPFCSRNEMLKDFIDFLLTRTH